MSAEAVDRARQLLAEGYNASLVANRLHQELGLSVEDSARIIRDLTGKTVASRHPSGIVHMLFGGATFAAGAIISAASLMASDVTGFYVLAYGAVLVGAAQFAAGVQQYRKPLELGAKPPPPP